MWEVQGQIDRVPEMESKERALRSVVSPLSLTFITMDYCIWLRGHRKGIGFSMYFFHVWLNVSDSNG